MNALINGVRLAWDDDGGGSPLLLIHGFPLNRHMWKPQVGALSAAGYRVITPDLRGFGESEAADAPYSMDLFVDDLAALLDHLRIERAVVGGMSMGGYILMRFIDRYPERVSASCFIATRSGADDDAGRERRLKLAREAMETGSQSIADIFSAMLFREGTERERPDLFREVREWMAGTAPQALSGGLIAMAGRRDYTSLLADFVQPSLVIGALQDRAVTPDHIRALAGGLPNGTLCMIPGAGHMVNMEQPDAFNSCLLRFLMGLKTP